jgi:predicted lipid-binding transport protein (Tim44 family)
MPVKARAKLAMLEKADPNFREWTFLSRAYSIFRSVLIAEGAANPDLIASVVTPAFLDCFKQRLVQWTTSKQIRVVSDVAIDPPVVFNVVVGPQMQAVTVRFSGIARRFTKDTVTDRVLEGADKLSYFAEFGTFVRPAGSITPKSVVESGTVHCPHCGGPVEEGAMTCGFCGVAISGAGGTWLLDHTDASPYT